MQESRQTRAIEIPFLVLLPYACEVTERIEEIGARPLRNGLPASGNRSEQPQLVGEAQRNGGPRHPPTPWDGKDWGASGPHALPLRAASTAAGSGSPGNFALPRMPARYHPWRFGGIRRPSRGVRAES